MTFAQKMNPPKDRQCVELVLELDQNHANPIYYIELGLDHGRFELTRKQFDYLAVICLVNVTLRIENSQFRKQTASPEGQPR